MIAVHNAVVVMLPITRDPILTGVPDDLAIASRYACLSRRNSFLAARYIVRTVLGLVWGQQPEDVAIVVSDSGRPFAAAPHSQLIDFSIAHSDELVGVAFSPDVRVGFDLEPATYVVRENAFELASTVNKSLASHFFVAAQKLGSPDPEIDCWLALEAYAKWLGCGISSKKLTPTALCECNIQWGRTILNHRLSLCFSDTCHVRFVIIENLQDLQRSKQEIEEVFGTAL